MCPGDSIQRGKNRSSVLEDVSLGALYGGGHQSCRSDSRQSFSRYDKDMAYPVAA